MAKEILTYDDLLQIVELIKSAEAFSEFHLKIGEIELDLRKASAAIPRAAESSSGTPASTTASPPPAATTIPAPAAASTERQPARTARAAFDIPASSVVIQSPMVGTFYRRPEPTARPFVEIGDTVDEDTTVCIIEVMKLMNSIPAGCKGRVTHMLVEDGEPVGARQQLIVIDPKGT
ncbi:MAG TPA: acetyl-CoA carboxylase biotin carboxyl carrier protein [Casimicrobiaceae bacterium]|nr:acetyl-CoA carboxylase biotin carboxyl carrier protein [Casimicrobiaceae bacterium]